MDTIYFDLEQIHFRIMSSVRSEETISFRKLAGFFVDVSAKTLTAESKRLVEAGILNRIGDNDISIVEGIKILSLSERPTPEARAGNGASPAKTAVAKPAKTRRSDAAAVAAQPKARKTAPARQVQTKTGSPAKAKPTAKTERKPAPKAAASPAPIALAGTARKALEIIVVTGGVRETDIAKAYPGVRNVKMHLKRVGEALDRLSELGLIRHGEIGGRSFTEATKQGEAQAVLLQAKGGFEDDDVLRQRIADHDHLTSADRLR